MVCLLEDQILKAIDSFDYPLVTYDFLRKRELSFHRMIELDHYLQNLLLSGAPDNLKDGLSGILYWGHYRAPYRDHRVAKFRTEVTDAELQRSSTIIQKLDGSSLTILRDLCLPQFSQMAFVTKLRTFLDPEHYCVLDSKIGRLKLLSRRLKRQKTYIPINMHNEEVYRYWVGICGSIATRLPRELRPVDVERGFFYLLDHNKPEIADEYLSSNSRTDESESTLMGRRELEDLVHNRRSESAPILADERELTWQKTPSSLSLTSMINSVTPRIPEVGVESLPQANQSTNARSCEKRLITPRVIHPSRMTTYVLGAGASVHSGCPLCSNLWSAMSTWARQTSHSGSSYIDTINSVEKLNGPVADVELMFTNLSVGQKNFSKLSGPDRQRLQGSIRECLKDFFVSIDSQNLPASLYAALANEIETGDTLISFNYDIALEKELIRAKKFHVRDGYGSSFVQGWDEPSSDVTVLKPHGSINWVGLLFGGARGGSVGTFSNSLGQRPFVDNSDLLFSDYPGRILDKDFPGGPVANQGVTLVLPAHEKQFLVRTSAGSEWINFYESLWSQAAESLKKSERIVVIGYSLPIADSRANTLILRGCNKDAEVFLCCASSNPSMAARFRESGFRRVRRVGSFEDWLALD